MRCEFCSHELHYDDEMGVFFIFVHPIGLSGFRIYVCIMNVVEPYQYGLHYPRTQDIAADVSTWRDELAA